MILLLPQLTLEFFCLPGCLNTSSEALEICAYSCGLLPCLSTALRRTNSSSVTWWSNIENDELILSVTEKFPGDKVTIPFYYYDILILITFETIGLVFGVHALFKLRVLRLLKRAWYKEIRYGNGR